MVPWRVGVTGTVTLDDVTTPHGRRRCQQGGSAVYSALAASAFARVELVAVVGVDGETSVRSVLPPQVDTAGLEVRPEPTFRWRAIHDFTTWVTSGEEADEGAYAGWTPRLSLRARDAEVLFVGSMRPALQGQVLDQSTARLVGIDTMVAHIGPWRDLVAAIVQRADVLFLNRAELAALTRTDEARWEEAARSLCGGERLRAVVVKAGPLGAACVTASTTVERRAHPVPAVVDPTGAGDALAGGMLGSCARARRADEAHLVVALEEGLRCAALAISDFGVQALHDGLGLPGGPSPARP